jgi:hypothetical protein
MIRRPWNSSPAPAVRDRFCQAHGLLKDAVRFVPELAPLAANALKEPDADDAEAESAAEPRARGDRLCPLIQRAG